MEQGGSSYLNQAILENPSQAYPEVCLLGEPGCCQAINQYDHHSMAESEHWIGWSGPALGPCLSKAVLQ